MVELSRIIARVADGNCPKDVSLQTENDLRMTCLSWFFGRLGDSVQPNKNHLTLQGGDQFI